MSTRQWARTVAGAAALLVASLLLQTTAARAAGDGSQEARAGVVFLVRHAEKSTDPAGDPALTDEGRERARTLARLLAPSGLTQVFSSDYRRTRETAAPVADALGLNLQLYDPRELEAFARQLRDTPGRILVVGHSNTTPELVKLLGGEPGAPIDEESEFDRLYMLVFGGDGVATIRQRYGAGR